MEMKIRIGRHTCQVAAASYITTFTTDTYTQQDYFIEFCRLLLLLLLLLLRLSAIRDIICTGWKGVEEFLFYVVHICFIIYADH